MKEWRIAEVLIRHGRGESPEYIRRQMDVKQETIDAVIAGTYRQTKAGEDRCVMYQDRALTLREFAAKWNRKHRLKNTISRSVKIHRKRLDRGWSPEKCMATPPTLKNPHRNKIRKRLRQDPWPRQRLPEWSHLTAMLWRRI